MTRSRDIADVQDNAGGAIPPFVAGKNKIINGDFGVWQRGTSFTNLQGFFADRFQTVPSGSVTSMTTSQQTFTPGAAPVAGYEGAFFARNTITTVGSLTTLDIQQRVEDVRTFAGQTVTLSFWAKGDSARSSIVYLAQNFGSGGSSETYTTTPTLSITTSWVRYSFTLSVASISGKTIGTNHYLSIGIRQAVAAGSVLDIWGVQVEAGSAATPFQTATGTKQGELAACQRYCVMYKADVTYNRYAVGLNYSTTKCNGNIFLPVEMRTAPSLTTTGTAANYAVNHGADTITACSAVPAINGAGSSNKVASIDATVASGLTAGAFGTILSNNNTSSYLLFTAEL